MALAMRCRPVPRLPRIGVSHALEDAAMAYVNPNFQTKKALKAALADGKLVEVFQPGMGFVPDDTDYVALEGPHYPAPHTWYAEGTMRSGHLVGIK